MPFPRLMKPCFPGAWRATPVGENLRVTASDFRRFLRFILFGLWRGAAAVVAELVPGFLEWGPAAGGVGGVEHDCSLLAADDAFCGDYVPDVFGDYVGGEVIEVSALVGQAAGGVDVAAVASLGAAGGGGLDLHAHEVSVDFYDGVVAGGVSPGIENLEAVFGGCGYEL
jgi:hypothetical protein